MSILHLLSSWLTDDEVLLSVNNIQCAVAMTIQSYLSIIPAVSTAASIDVLEQTLRASHFCKLFKLKNID